jgi:HK97 family phage prohead protease
MKREIRTLRCTELRAKTGDKPGIEGYAAVFNQRSQNLGGFRETIVPGAFSRALKEDQDVRALVNHDPNQVLGRTKSGTLQLSEDKKGLRFSVDMPDTQTARDLMTSIARGDVDQCSFAFSVRKQAWGDGQDDDTGEKIAIRELHDVDLFDVSAVTYPAYPQTSVDTRSLFPDGVPEEVREHVPERRAEAKTKKVDGVDLTSDCFAFVGDLEDTSTWKLPIKFPGDAEKTKSHCKNALARFNQTKGIPADKKTGVWKKIVAAAKKAGVKVSESDSIRSALTPEQLRVLAKEEQDDDCACECSACQNENCALCTDEDCADENCDHGADRSAPGKGAPEIVTAEERERLLAVLRQSAI